MHLILYLSILLTASASILPLRAVDPCVQDVQEVEAVELDGPTADKTAGFGAEFESPFFYFTSFDCSVTDTTAARKKSIAGRKGTNWQLEADSTGDQGKVNAEYVLDGINIKVGSGDGARAAKAWVDDLIDWKPWAGTPPNFVNIGDSKCNPWTVATSPKSGVDDLSWSPQITAPMPLEALYSLMVENEDTRTVGEKNILDGTSFLPDEALIVVTQEYFQSNPNNIDKTKITDDVLAFCSLVLSYAKAASRRLTGNSSPKLFTEFMPRTEFITIFGIVKTKLTGDLFKLFDNLACYKTEINDKTRKKTVVIDTDYCRGPLTAPVSNGKLRGLSYTNGAADPPATVNIKDWIAGIGSGTGVGEPPVDALSNFDRSVDKSIGGLGYDMEKMYNSQRSVPLFEFRDLDIIKTPKAEQFMTNVDSAIQALHAKFANPPTKRKRDAPKSCERPFAASALSSVASVSSATPSTIVIAPVDPPSQPSCIPPPTGAVKDSHEDELQKAATLFCKLYAASTAQTGPINVADIIIAGDRSDDRQTRNIAYLYSSNQGNQDDVYDLTVTSIPGCDQSGPYNLATPVANNNCADILHTAWKSCNNKGRGGAITAGCLVYSVATKF